MDYKRLQSLLRGLNDIPGVEESSDGVKSYPREEELKTRTRYADGNVFDQANEVKENREIGMNMQGYGPVNKTVDDLDPIKKLLQPDIRDNARDMLAGKQYKNDDNQAYDMSSFRSSDKMNNIGKVLSKALLKDKYPVQYGNMLNTPGTDVNLSPEYNSEYSEEISNYLKTMASDLGRQNTDKPVEFSPYSNFEDKEKIVLNPYKKPEELVRSYLAKQPRQDNQEEETSTGRLYEDLQKLIGKGK